MTRPTLAPALAMLALLLPACKSAPRTLAESRDEGIHADAYWDTDGPATLANAAGPRVALAEVVVEFVTSKNQSAGRSQAAFLPPHPVFLAASAAGVGRKNVEFAGDAFERIADRVAEALVGELRARGAEPLPADLVEEARSHATWETLPPGEPEDVREINFAATDTGRIRAMRRVPALGTRIVTSPDTDADRAAAALLGELDADAVLRATIRVGVYLQHASLEQGSRLALTTPDGTTRAAARRSLLSDRQVLDETSNASEWTVSLDAYLDAIDATAPAFLGMALDTLADDTPLE